MSSPHVLIIGAGLGGPALALALARHSIRSTIFERQPGMQDIGGVLMLASNAMSVLDKVVGVEKDLRPLGYTYTGIELQAGSPGGRLEYLGSMGQQGEYKGMTIKRPILHKKLLDLCEEKEGLVEVRYGKALKEIEEDSNGVTAIFEDGSSAKGDILLGVDGIHSRVRQHVLGGAEKAAAYPATYTGRVVVGGTISRSQVDLTGVTLPAFLLAPIGTILTFATDPKGETLQWAAFLKKDERPRKEWQEYRSCGECIKDVKAEWGVMSTQPFSGFLDTLTTSNMAVWAPYAIPELPTWHTDRVCLIGDAAHAISPSAGQGTAQALEDVGLMVRLLTSLQAMAKGYPALFEHYEKSRRERLVEVRKFTDRAAADREGTSGAWAWWFKKNGLKAALFAMSGLRGVFRGAPAFTYDVTQVPIDVK